MNDSKPTLNYFYGIVLCELILLFGFGFWADLIFVGNTLLHYLTPDLRDYPYQNPPVFFSIGEALASIAILLAVYQFRKEKWSIALRVRSYIVPTVFSTVLLGVILTTASSFVLVQNPTNMLQLSIFWQVVASVFIATSVALLLLKASNKRLFNERSARKFYEVMTWELSRPSPERLEIILNALLDNLDAICKAASQNTKSELSQSAVAILDVVLGESSLVDVITTKRFDALHYLLVMVEKYALNHRKAEGVSRIIKNLFIDQNSFLYKHLEMSGLALSSNLYELLFGSPVILANFNLFGWPTLDYKMQKNLNSLQLSVFIKSLSKSIETYLKTDAVPPRYINDGLSHLSEIFQDICFKINTEEERGVDTNYALKDEWWSLHMIARFIGHEYVFLAYQDDLNQDVVDREKTATEASFYSNSTINEGVAAILYKSFEHLTYIKDSNDIYHLVHQLLYGLTYERQYKEGYCVPFEKRMWEQIGNNVINRHYPAALRTYLTSIGFSVASKAVGERGGWIGEQTERIRALLYVDLKPLFDRGEKMVNDKKMEDVLLPDGMKYKDGKFIYTMGFGRGPTVEIQEPPSGSVSALEGVNLETTSLL
ncbi:hypothetical protein K8Q93_01890 [Candidatus Parcubacteria bacterium]|nr:hypothetical protein [Candidatus Parcubacteria bacterium]